MAIVKAVGGGRNLRQVIAYVLRKDKTKPELTGGWNVDPENACEEMMATKRQWHKTDGRAYKHFVQSFHVDDDITPTEAHMMACELVERSDMFRDYEVLYATHIDREHVHTHIVVNSVGISTGRKFRYSKAELEDLKRLSDEIVREHGYRLEHERPETDNVTAWDQDLYQVLLDAHEGRRSSWMYDTAIAVQDAMEHAEDPAGFIREMESRGYSVRWGARSITYTAPDGHKVRAKRLEEIFKLESVRARYVDRESEQEQLRKDLIQAKQKDGRSHNDTISGIDYSVFDTDLKTLRESLRESIPDDGNNLFETACAVCRHLRESPSAEDFDARMTADGFWVEYDYVQRLYIFRHSSGVEFTNADIEQRFGLPSIRQALDYLILRLYVPPGQEGVALAEQICRQTDDEYRDMLRRTKHRAVWVVTPTAEKEPRQTAAGMTEVHENQSYSLLPQQIKPSVRNDGMVDLLQIVRKASAASDRETFEALLREQGCGTRWTSTGTLTFILPTGVHIRAARLEQRYNLPSIAAAYGRERKVPTNGIRYETAMLIERTMAQGSSIDELNAALKAAGYSITWKADGSDASITAPDGRRMRLSGLDRTFNLKSVRERIFSGIQHKKDDGKHAGDGVGKLREALTTADESIHCETDRTIFRTDRGAARQRNDAER